MLAYDAQQRGCDYDFNRINRMCGLAGLVDFTGSECGNVLSAMTDSLTHRGPDARGELSLKSRSNCTIGLGHRRLAIIDLSPSGNQPMSRGDLHIVFNGEIYNYEELRNQLIEAGATFNSHGDTEVILVAVAMWGIERTLSCLNGMFAFAIYDAKADQLILARDRAGVKPLYVYQADSALLFASEPKAFKHYPNFDGTICPDAVELFLRYGYVPDGHCIYQRAKKVPPGHYLTLDLASKHETSVKYWDVFDSFNLPKLKIDFTEASEQLEQLLQSSFDYRMVADVPVGIFLSGGYDSSTVAAMLQKHASQKLKTFTIGFELSSFDESTYAREIAEHLGTDHTEYMCTVKEAQDIIPTLADYYDEPFGDSSAIPTILVSRIARQSVKVALSADAGDELFAGYNKYSRALQMLSVAQRVPKLLHSGGLFRTLAQVPLPNQFGLRTLENLASIYGGHASTCHLMNLSSQVFNDSELTALLRRPIASPKTIFDSESLLNNGNDGINRMLAVDYKTYLPDDILTKVDRATMSVSLEGREPLLDYRLAEFTARLPSEFKIKGSERKRIFKSVAHRYIPKQMLDRPKKGFSVPYFAWLRSDLRDLLEHHLSTTQVDRFGVLNSRFVGRFKKRFLAGDTKTNVGVWNLLMFQMWMDRWQ